MRLEGENVLCRFMLTNFVQYHHRPVYEALVEKAWRLRMAGATVFRGIMGYVLDGPVLDLHPWWPANQLPMIVEMVDQRERIEHFLGLVQPIFTRGIITLERAHVVYYRASDLATDVGITPPRVDTIEEENAVESVPLDKASEAMLLRVFIDDSDTDPQSNRPLYDRLVHMAHDMNLAGATVLRGTVGFGKHSVMHAAKLIDVSMDMPVIIELVDEETKIRAYLTAIDPIVPEGLVTMEKVRIFKYQAREK